MIHLIIIYACDMYKHLSSKGLFIVEVMLYFETKY